MYKNLKNLSLLLIGAMLIGFVGCEKEPDDPKDVIASFQYEVDATNFLQVNFTNFSQNASAFAWDFGDGNTSTEESPSHTYGAAGTYSVKLVASSTDKDATRSETIILTDPNTQLALLAGDDTKTWYLQREGIALGIGPGLNDNSWWSFGGVTPLGDRPCILDDAFTFTRDGAFEFSSNGTIYADAPGDGGWIEGFAGGCLDEAGNLTSTAGDDLSAFADGGDYTYDYDNAGNTLTLNGLGAYIGLPNKTPAGDNYIPISEKTYEIIKLVEGDIADSLQIALVGADFYWNFYLVSYANASDLPDIPSAMPSANFSFTKDGSTVTFTNTSINATTYSWNFGDGNMSTDENPVHTYAGDGTYEVTLTAMDDASNSSESKQNVTISSASFSAAVVQSADGKIWKLDGAASFYVGPAAGSNEWWPGITEGELGDRACQLDDEFIFFTNGDMQFDSKGQVFAEPYMGGANNCLNDEDILPPNDVLTSATHTFTIVEAAGDDPATITVTGDGAYLGFSKPFNGGELDGAIVPASEVVYDVFDYAQVGGQEILTLVIDINGEGTAWWTIRLVSE